jgi:hypothetical protein
MRADNAPFNSSPTDTEEEAPVQPDGIICPDCNTANEAGWSFCQQCGKRLPKPSPPAGFGQTPASLKTVPEPQARIEAPESSLRTVADKRSIDEVNLKTIADKSAPAPDIPKPEVVTEPAPEEWAHPAVETPTVVVAPPGESAAEPPPYHEPRVEAPPPPAPPLKTEHVASISGVLCNQCGQVSAVGSTSCANCGAPITFGKTQVMTSQPAPARGRLHLVMEGGQPGEVYQLSEDTTIGRSAGDIIFPHDGFMSGRHARIVQRGAAFFLTDEGSRNGTFVKIKGEVELKPGDMILVGKQLFRFEV